MKQTRTYLNTKNVYVISILVISLAILIVWLSGLTIHRTFYKNSLLTNAILSIAFFTFLSISLFKGIKLKDNIGKLSDKIKYPKLSSTAEIVPDEGITLLGEGLEGIAISVILWIVASILLVVFVWMFGIVVWTIIVWLLAVLYWIFFRSLRLVFKNANICKGKIGRSILYALIYTLLYTLWINVMIEMVYIVI